MNENDFPKEKKILVLFGILFLNLIIISTSVPLRNKKSLLENILSTIASPFQIGFQKTANFISKEFKRHFFLKKSFKKYVELNEKYRQLKYDNYQLKKKIIELGFLTEAQKRFKKIIAADVISIDQSFPMNSLFINKGFLQQIRKNMVVLNSDGELVGKIVEPITFFSAKVRLITSPIGGVGAYIKTNNLEGLLTGNNNQTCNFKYLIKNKPVNIGDIVVTSGTDEIFPAYMPIGRVTQIQKEPLIQEVLIKPFFVEKPIKHLIVIENE